MAADHCPERSTIGRQQPATAAGGDLVTLVTHARYYSLSVSESYLTRRLFPQMLGRIAGPSLAGLDCLPAKGMLAGARAKNCYNRNLERSENGFNIGAGANL